MGNDSTTAFGTREQLVKFLGMFSPRFSKPAREFVGEMLFGIRASQVALLSEIGRSPQEGIRIKKTEERLCRHLANQRFLRYEDSVLFRSHDRSATSASGADRFPCACRSVPRRSCISSSRSGRRATGA